MPSVLCFFRCLACVMVLVAGFTTRVGAQARLAQRTQARLPDQVTPSRDVPSDTVKVQVLSPDGKPLPDVIVMLGTLKSQGSREKIAERTNAQGEALFAKLQTGSAQAYRVSVPYSGATYGSTPFRLEGDQGVLVRIVRHPVTHDAQWIVQALSQIILGFRDDRLHVIQQAQLINLGQSTFVFPKQGWVLRLPENVKAFQTGAVMTDQRISQQGKDLRIRGSLPPGQVVLAWAYDLPLESPRMTLSIPLGFNTYRARVLTEAPQGLGLVVDDFPKAQLFEDGQQRVLLTELKRQATDPPLEIVNIALDGIPGPGALRWVAVALALCVGLAGIVYALRVRKSKMPNPLSNDGREQLVRYLLELDSLRAQNEIGPRYYEQQKRELLDALALELKAQELGAQKPVPQA